MNGVGRIQIKNLALYVDTERHDAVAAAKNVAGIANDAGVALQLSVDQAKLLKLNGAGATSFPANADLVLTDSAPKAEFRRAKSQMQLANQPAR